MDRHVLLAAEDALVDLRRQVARNLDGQGRQKIVGAFEFGVDAPYFVGLERLLTNEGQAQGRRRREIDQQVFERKQVDGDRRRPGHYPTTSRRKLRSAPASGLRGDWRARRSRNYRARAAR